MPRRTTMRRLCDGKMWKAVNAMIKGMLKHSKRKGFEIDMDTFGSYNYDLQHCAGCAATCTIQQLAGVSFMGDKIGIADTRSKFVNVTHNDLFEFEIAVNRFRKGYQCGAIEPLLCYFKIKPALRPQIIEKFEKLSKLNNDNWKEHLPAYRKFCNYLKKLDV